MMDYSEKVHTSDVDGALSGARDELCHGGGNIALCAVIISISAMLVSSFQSGFFSVIRPFGIAPDLCLAFSVACGLLFGSRLGALAGIASGFFIDAMSSGGITANIILYFLCGTVIGLFQMAEPRPFRDVWRYMAAVSVAVCGKKIVEALWVVLTAPSLDASRLYTELVLRGIICTALCSLLVYIPTAVAYSVFRRVMATKRVYR